MKNKLVKLNLGCGEIYLKDYINCDFVKRLKVDKIVDLNKFPYPFKDNYADEILLDNVLEHLGDLVLVMQELHRILKKGGKLKIIVPYAKSDGAFQDPTHTHFFTEKTMDYFTLDSKLNFYSTARFKKISVDLTTEDYSFLNKIRTLMPFRNRLKYIFFNMYDTLSFELEAI